MLLKWCLFKTNKGKPLMDSDTSQTDFSFLSLWEEILLFSSIWQVPLKLPDYLEWTQHSNRISHYSVSLIVIFYHPVVVFLVFILHLTISALCLFCTTWVKLLRLLLTQLSLFYCAFVCFYYLLFYFSLKYFVIYIISHYSWTRLNQ